jgi:hypothetical protein
VGSKALRHTRKNEPQQEARVNGDFYRVLLRLLLFQLNAREGRDQAEAERALDSFLLFSFDRYQLVLDSSVGIV